MRQLPLPRGHRDRAGLEPGGARSRPGGRRPGREVPARGRPRAPRAAEPPLPRALARQQRGARGARVVRDVGALGRRDRRGGAGRPAARGPHPVHRARGARRGRDAQGDGAGELHARQGAERPRAGALQGLSRQPRARGAAHVRGRGARARGARHRAHAAGRHARGAPGARAPARCRLHAARVGSALGLVRGAVRRLRPADRRRHRRARARAASPREARPSRGALAGEAADRLLRRPGRARADPERARGGGVRGGGGVGAAARGGKGAFVSSARRGAPEPIRSALVEGASWWARAFEAAGFIDAFQVKLLPPGADPLDVRYNVVEWVHRATRGWSYGGGIVDPRTGERLKAHVTRGSLRIRQDRLIFEGLAGAAKPGTGAPDDPVQLSLARIRQLAAHEVGHTLGFTHNFAASTYAGRASVMDYPAPLVGIRADSTLDFSNAYATGVGAWDVQQVRYAYPQFAPGR